MITLSACLFSSLHCIWQLLLGVSVWPEEYGIFIESAHFSLGLRVWDRRFCTPAGVCDTESVYWCSGDFSTVLRARKST